MNSSRDWELLLRYVTGECDPAEARDTLRWINADPERIRAANELSRLHEAGVAALRSWDVETAWRKVAASRVGGVPKSEARRAWTFASVPRSARLIGRIAAGIVLVAGSAVWYWASTRKPAAGSGPAAMQEIVTQRGQLTMLRLSDGSRVTLAPASRIRYHRSFGAPGRPRDVYLEGRGLFDVAHDAARPFRVHTRYAVAQDVGTRFVVTSYPGDAARIAVVEGIVSLQGAQDTAVLHRGDVGTVAKGELVVVHDTDIAADTVWTGGRLAFRDTPLRIVAPELARWFDLDIKLADSSLNGLLLTATFADASRGAVLTDIMRTLRLRSEQRGSVVWLFRQ